MQSYSSIQSTTTTTCTCSIPSLPSFLTALYRVSSGLWCIYLLLGPVYGAPQFPCIVNIIRVALLQLNLLASRPGASFPRLRSIGQLDDDAESAELAGGVEMASEWGHWLISSVWKAALTLSLSRSVSNARDNTKFEYSGPSARIMAMQVSS